MAESLLTQKSTRPIMILCTLSKNASDKLKKEFDFIIHAVKVDADNNQQQDKKVGASGLHIYQNPVFDNLWKWFLDLNFYKEAPNRDIMGKDKLEDRKLDDYEVRGGKWTG